MINLFSNKIKNYLIKKKIKIINIDNPLIIFSDIWGGNSQNGELITNAKYPIIEIQNIDNFDFLRDLKSCGILKTRSIARKIVNYWIDNNKNLFTIASPSSSSKEQTIYIKYPPTLIFDAAFFSNSCCIL